MSDSPEQQSVRRVRPKYQVFVSSTYRDLRNERERVSWEILKARHIPAGMEAFPATDDRGWRIIERTINTSDYYVLLLAGRYGAVDADSGTSWTEREYRHARTQRIPILAFIRDSAHITSDKMESDHKLQVRLEALIAEVRDSHLCDTWTTAEDLCAKVGAALRHQIDEDEDSGIVRPGWYRGDQVPSIELMEEFARVSAESASLRGELAKLSRGNAALQLAELDGGKPSSSVLKLQARAGAGAPISGERFSRAFQFIVRNTGSGLASSVAARFHFQGVQDCHFEDWLPESMNYGRYLPPENWFRELGRHVHVERAFREEDGFVVVQRVRSIGPGADEVLVRMVPEFRFGPNDVVGSSRKFRVSYRLAAETAPPTEGQFEFEIGVAPAPPSTEESVQVEDGSKTSPKA